MFVSFFSLVMLTSMSSAREFSPTIMPSYTSVPGSTNSWPRSCRLVIANAVTAPDRSATIEPLLRVRSHRAVAAGAQLTEPGLVVLEEVVQDAGAAGLGEEFRTETDEAASGHQ